MEYEINTCALTSKYVLIACSRKFRYVFDYLANGQASLSSRGFLERERVLLIYGQWGAPGCVNGDFPFASFASTPLYIGASDVNSHGLRGPEF